MDRRQFLGVLAGTPLASLFGLRNVSADSQLEPGTWYDATVTNVTDGDTFDVVLDSDGTEYDVRHLGMDSPETKSNSQYEEVREWEGLEDDQYISDWGENAKSYAQNEFPDGTSVQIAVDENEDEVDPYGRLLAYMRYDKSGDGSMDTHYNLDVVRQGYARIYSSSLTKHDKFWKAEQLAQADGNGIWQQSDLSQLAEVNNNPVSTVFFPNVSSIRTDSGAIGDSRVPVYAESTAYQDLNSGGVDYADIPLVGVDEANNTAMVGGLFIDEYHEDNAEGEHQVFLSNLIDYLSSKTGPVMIEGGHRQFNIYKGLSCEDTVVYQRFLEGVDLNMEGINSVDDTTYNDLSQARALIVTTAPQSFTASEKDAISTYISNGGAVILIGSATASAEARSNLHDVAAGIGTDLRLNEDQVYDDSNNTGDSYIITTSVFDTSYPLYDSYTPDSSSNDSPQCSIVNPADGDTVSGTVTVQVDASDTEDDDTTLDVEVAIDGGSWQTASYNSTSGTYEYDWDTTGVSDGDHTIDARATDSDGATTNASTVTVSVDNIEDAPTVDNLSLSEVETDNSDAEFDADWQVSDVDGDLSSVDLKLSDDTDAETEESASVSVSGDTASGTTRLVAAGDDGTGNSYTVELVVSDSAGNSSSATASATESEGRSDVLTADPDTANTASYHTWTLSDPSSDYSGEVDTITVDYPSGTSLDGLTDADVTVYMDRDGDGTVDEIAVNSDSYSGSTATFDLDGRYNTSVEGEVRVEIDGVTNPDAGDYIATETLSGDDSLTVDAEYVVSTSSLAVSSDYPTNVEANSATLNGSLDDLGGASSADCYFEWRKVGASTWNTTAAQTLSATGSFSEDLTGLESGTDYEYRAVADASDGDSDTGSIVGVTTDSDSSVAVSSDYPTNVEANSATLNGSLDDLGGASSADCYFEWRKVGASTWNTTAAQTLTSTGSFSEDLTGLESGTNYEYRAVADASDGDSDTGSIVGVTTDSDASVAVSSDYPTNVEANSATLNGSLDDLGGASSADCYFEWRKVGSSTWNTTAAQTLSATGSFSEDLTGLESGTNYEYRAVADASDGDSDTGSIVGVTTDSDASVAVSTASPSNVTDSSATLNGSLDDLGGASSADCYFEYRPVGASSWTTTTAQTLSSTGSFSQDISGLSAGTDYEYRAIADASDGDSDTGSTVSFTTDSTSSAPSIDTFSLTDRSNPAWTRYDVDWAVSDVDGDLASVESELLDSAGTVVDTDSDSISGSSASGTHELRTKGSASEIVLTVTDAAGNSTSSTKVL